MDDKEPIFEPLIEGSRVIRESFALIYDYKQYTGLENEITIPLRFLLPPERIIAVETNDLKMLNEGEDFIIDRKKSDPLTPHFIIPKKSRLSALAHSEIIRDPEVYRENSIQFVRADIPVNPDSIDLNELERLTKMPRRGKNRKKNRMKSPDGSKTIYYNLLWSEEGLFQKHQIYVTYIPRAPKAGPESPKGSFRSGDFPEISEVNRMFMGHFHNLFEKSDKNTINLLLIGDSISEGANASLKMGIPPFIPPFGDQIGRYLADKYPQKRVVLTNIAKGGTTSTWGKKNISSLMMDAGCNSPDIAFIAFGVNDSCGGIKPGKYRRNVLSMIKDIKNLNDDCLILLLGSLPPNNLWSPTNNPLLKRYMHVLRAIADKDDGIEFIDLLSIWERILERKWFYDVTGNGVNHPNDYGHRVYAFYILQALNLL